MSDNLVLYDARPPAVIITMNRADKRNALSRGLIQGLTDAFARARDDASARCVILTAAGPTFCAGMDLAEPTESREQGKVAFKLEPGRGVEITLPECGRACSQLLCRPGGGAAIRTVVSIGERMPEVGRRFCDNVLARTGNRFSAYREARGQLGDLVIEDYELAAWQFMQMCQATLFQAFVFQAKPAPSAEQIAKVVDSATRMFLVAYRAKTD